MIGKYAMICSKKNCAKKYLEIGMLFLFLGRSPVFWLFEGYMPLCHVWSWLTFFDQSRRTYQRLTYNVSTCRTCTSALTVVIVEHLSDLVFTIVIVTRHPFCNYAKKYGWFLCYCVVQYLKWVWRSDLQNFVSKC